MTDRDSTLLAALAAVLGEAHVLTNDADMVAYVSDWRRNYPGAALAVLRPASTDQVSQVVALCAAAGVPLIPQGGNTGLV